MTNKQYLEGIRQYRVRIRQAKSQRAELRLNLDGINGIDYTRDKIQTSPRNATEEAGWKLAAELDRLNQEIRILSLAVNERLTAIRELPPPYSDVLMLRYSEYKKWDEIAQITGYSLNYVMGELHGRGLQKIKKPVK